MCACACVEGKAPNVPHSTVMEPTPVSHHGGPAHTTGCSFPPRIATQIQEGHPEAFPCSNSLCSPKPSAAISHALTTLSAVSRESFVSHTRAPKEQLA